jgi:hypothetical protein
MAIPPNTTLATAVDLGPLTADTPVTLTLDVKDGSTFYTVWYKYTAVAGDNVLNVFGFGDLTNYRPVLSVYRAGEMSYLDIVAQNRPVQLPVSAGTTYYFKCESAGTRNPANNSTLTLRIQRHLNAEAAAGSILVNDDTDGFPWAVLSSVDGHVLQFWQPGIAPNVFPAGEKLFIIHAAKRMLLSDTATGSSRLYNTDTFVLIATVPLDADDGIITGNRVETFYLGVPTTPVTIRTVSLTGVIGPTTWTLADNGLSALAVNAAGTIAYHNGQVTSTQSRIRRHDLTTDLPLSDLVADVTPGNYVANNMVMLADDTLIVGYRGVAPVAIRYDASGATLNTYPLTAYATVDRVCPDPDGASFWVWYQPGGNIDHFVRYRASDGVILTDVPNVQYENGAYQGAVTATPVDWFGHSFSCHFGILPATLAVPPGLPARRGCLPIMGVG